MVFQEFKDKISKKIEELFLYNNYIYLNIELLQKFFGNDIYKKIQDKQDKEVKQQIKDKLLEIFTTLYDKGYNDIVEDVFNADHKIILKKQVKDKEFFAGIEIYNQFKIGQFLKDYKKHNIYIPYIVYTTKKNDRPNMLKIENKFRYQNKDEIYNNAIEDKTIFIGKQLVSSNEDCITKYVNKATNILQYENQNVFSDDLSTSTNDNYDLKNESNINIDKNKITKSKFDNLLNEALTQAERKEILKKINFLNNSFDMYDEQRQKDSCCNCNSNIFNIMTESLLHIFK